MELIGFTQRVLGGGGARKPEPAPPSAGPPARAPDDVAKVTNTDLL